MALSAVIIGVLHGGIVAGVLVVLTPAIVVGLIWVLLRRERRHRVRRLPEGVLATATATARSHHLRSFDPTLQLQGGPNAHFIGDVEVCATTIAWRPGKRFRRRGAHDIVVPWANVEEMNCLRLGGLFRCDACSLLLRDGRELLVYITSPVSVETAASSLGVRVTGDPVEARAP